MVRLFLKRLLALFNVCKHPTVVIVDYDWLLFPTKRSVFVKCSICGKEFYK